MVTVEFEGWHLQISNGDPSVSTLTDPNGGRLIREFDMVTPWMNCIPEDAVPPNIYDGLKSAIIVYVSQFFD
jgi:hypothetical protein